MGAINRKTRPFNRASRAHDEIVAGVLAIYPQAVLVRSIDQSYTAASTIIKTAADSKTRVYVGPHGGAKIGETKTTAHTCSEGWKDKMRKRGQEVLATREYRR